MPDLVLSSNAQDAPFERSFTRFPSASRSSSSQPPRVVWKPVPHSPIWDKYLHVTLVDFGQLHKDTYLLKATFPLDRSGGFDIGMVRRAWGLRQCSVRGLTGVCYPNVLKNWVSKVIDTARGEIYQPSNPDWLESVMVRLLSDKRRSLIVCGK